MKRESNIWETRHNGVAVSLFTTYIIAKMVKACENITWITFAGRRGGKVWNIG
jgi:hypothetical protein